MRSLLENAVRKRHVLLINYPPGERLIEPHTLGYGKNGQLLLRAYQTAGASASGEPDHWKLFRVDRCLSAKPSGDVFQLPRDGYKLADPVMNGGIIAELPAPGAPLRMSAR